MKFSKLGLLGILASVSLNSISNAQFVRPFMRTNEQVNNLEPPNQTEKLNDRPPAESAALAPLNPYATPNPNQLIHLEYFRYVPERNTDETEIAYLNFLRTERQGRRNIEYSWPLEKIQSWMKAGLSIYSKDWEGYPYEISIKEKSEDGETGSEVKSYEGIVKNNGKISGLDDLGVFSLSKNDNKRKEPYIIEVEAKIRTKDYPGDVLASETKNIIVD